MDKTEKDNQNLSEEELKSIAGGEKDDFHWRQCPSCKTWVEIDCMGHGICPKCGYRWD